MWKLCLGQFAVDFYNCPNIETFASWDFLSHALRIMIKNWSNDVCGFKIRCWPKFLTFDCQMTILPLQLTVKHLGFLTVQFDVVSLETWHMDAWQCIWAYRTWLDPWKPQFLCKNPNPNFDCVRRQLDCATLGRFWTLILANLEEYGRANFGVQQLPLFNLLRPEDVDWLACLS